jgi:uncharacterized protein YfaT (DUF1175 family)
MWCLLLLQAALVLPPGAERAAFRGWFTWLAEAQAWREPRDLPPEIKDCAALVRYSYREALRRHDAGWLREQGFESAPPLADVRRPPAGPPFTVAGGRRVHFADARNLLEYNTHLVARDVRAAEPGDLLFYRRLAGLGAWHSMIYLGVSRFEKGPERYVVYHTGPQDGGPGEMRRPKLSELLNHPAAEWRPVEANQNFLGVYRWNMLGEGQ